MQRLTWRESLLVGAAYVSVTVPVGLWFANGERRQDLTLLALTLVLGFIPTRRGVKLAATLGAALSYFLTGDNVAGSPYVPHADLPLGWLAFFWAPTLLGSLLLWLVAVTTGVVSHPSRSPRARAPRHAQSGRGLPDR